MIFDIFKKPTHEKKFDRRVLRKNDISILILDERWNSLFNATQKTPQIVKCEEQLRELLKEQARITAESREIAQRKKVLMDKIIKLTPEAFDNDNEEAKKEMQQCQKDILKINERTGHLQEALDNIPERIKQTNLELLEYTVNLVYFKIRASQKRVKELEHFIEETREKLKQFIDEKESLAQEGTDTYSYFHDLLGGEELEKLDKQYFGDS